MSFNSNKQLNMQALLDAYVEKQLATQSIEIEFPEKVASLTDEYIIPTPCENRVDLRSLPCLTIDCTGTQDMDDALSLQRRQGGRWLLGVHIADVASYAPFMSELDDVAKARGSSIYLPDQTIPMLPRVLSENLCSLMPGEDRKAVSVLATLDDDGALCGFEIAKSFIRSRVKGVYGEVDSVLEGGQRSAAATKYAGLEGMLEDMERLSNSLRESRIASGFELSSRPDHRFTVSKDKVEVECCEQTRSERIVEEFMLLANRLVAEFFDQHGLPLIRRIQEDASGNACYSTERIGHAGLAMEAYTHFTSPIRRLADLKVHQVLSAYLSGVPSSVVRMVFGGEMEESAEIATKRYRRARSLQKAVSNFYKRLYFWTRRNRYFTGTVTRSTQNMAEVVIDGIKLAVEVPLRLVERLGQRISFKVFVEIGNRRIRAVAISPLS